MDFGRHAIPYLHKELGMVPTTWGRIPIDLFHHTTLLFFYN